jgi:hypothetical protein
MPDGQSARDGARLYRRQRERGPWFCADCNRPQMNDITTFRRHMVMQHNKYCSWSGHIRPFVDGAEAERIRAVIARAGRRSSNGGQGRRFSPTRATDPAGDVYRPAVRRLRQEPFGVDDLPPSNQPSTSTVSTDRSGDVSANVALPSGIEYVGILRFRWVAASLRLASSRQSRTTPETREAESQTVSPQTHRREFGVQTSCGDPLHLPTGWSVERLVELAFSEPHRSPRHLALAVARQLGSSLSPGQLDNVTMVLEAQVETVRFMLARVETF